MSVWKKKYTSGWGEAKNFFSFNLVPPASPRFFNFTSKCGFQKKRLNHKNSGKSRSWIVSKIPRNHVFRYYYWRFPHSHHRFFLIVLPYLLLLYKSQLICCSRFFTMMPRATEETEKTWKHRSVSNVTAAVMSLSWCKQLTVALEI